jgi:hypothetical protein
MDSEKSVDSVKSVDSENSVDSRNFTDLTKFYDFFYLKLSLIFEYQHSFRRTASSCATASVGTLPMKIFPANGFPN